MILKNLIIAFGVIVFAGAVTFTLDHSFKNNRGDFFILEKGKAVPDFSFQTINDDNHSLSDFSDKAILIHFWATWCAPCIVEFPELIKLANKRNDIAILAFSSDRTINPIQRFIKQDLPDNFKIIHDQKQKITRDNFSVFRLPETYIVKPNMILDDHIVGAYTGWHNLDF